MSNAEHYFKQTQYGESRWWSWLSTLWLTIVVWVVLSGVFGVPIPFIVAGSNPEMFEQYIAASMAQQQQYADDPNYLILGALMGASVFFGVILWIIHRLTKNTARKIFGWLAGICMVTSTFCAIKLFPMFNDPEVNAAFMPMIGESAIAYALMLASFPAFLVGLYFCQKIIHRRTIVSLHTAAAKIKWKRILFAIGVTWGVVGILTILLHVTGISTVRATFDPSRFFAFALVTLIFIPLQSGTEEIIFRGYFNQALGHYISNKWVVFFITSVMFAAMHLSNPEALAGADKGGFVHLLVMSQYFLFGFILSVIVYFEGGLEAAIGVHAGNNMFAAMFVNYEGSVLPTPSAFIAVPNAQTDAWVAIIVLVLIAGLLYKTRTKVIPAPAPDRTPENVFG